MSDENDFTKLKVTDLRRLCKDRGLPIIGSKNELLSRLNQHEDEEAALTEPTPSLDEVKEAEELLQDVPDEQADTRKPEVKVSVEKEKKNLVPIKGPVSSEELLNQKKAERLKRFSVSPQPTTKTSNILSEAEKKQKRVERFKSNSTKDTPLTSSDNLEARKKRFGTVTSPTNQDNNDDIKAKRAKRFSLKT